MIKLVQIVWLLLPAAGLAYHYGPGQELMARDRAARRLDSGVEARSEGHFDEAAAGFGMAAEALPASAQRAKRSLALAEADAKLDQGDNLEAQQQLESLLTELKDAGEGDGDLALRARQSLAKASYYAAWIMRLEGASAEEWKPEVHRAQQNYRLLAERFGDSAVVRDSSNAKAQTSERAARENLEAAVRLEQMDLAALYALPLPKDCKCNCESLSQRKRKQCQGQCKSPGNGKKDAREEVKKAKGAGLTERSGTGS